MKTNAPDKLWLGKCTQNLMLTNPNSNTYVEYTRTDAFIEKACSILKDISCQIEIIEQFKKRIR